MDDLIGWNTKKQNRIATSTTEAKSQHGSRAPKDPRKDHHDINEFIRNYKYEVLNSGIFIISMNIE